MAKICVFLLGILVILGMTISTSYAQSVEKGVLIIDPYYGFSQSGDKFADWVTESQDPEVSSLGPLGGRIEYMIANRMGLGLIFNYNAVNVTWESRDSTGTIVDSTGTMTLTNVMVNINFHLAASSDVLDLYIGLAVGTAMRQGTLSADTPGAVNKDIDWESFANPFGIRAALGGRYYFTDTIGANAEIGIGGPLVSAGISVKF